MAHILLIDPVQELLAFCALCGIVAGAVSVLWRNWNTVRRAFKAAVAIEREFGPEVGRAIGTSLEVLRHRVSFLERRMDVQETLEEIGILQCAVDGQCLYANKKAQEMLGRESAEFFGFGWISLFDQAMDLHEKLIYAVKNKFPFRAEATSSGSLYFLVAQEVIATDHKTIIGYVTTIAKYENANSSLAPARSERQ